MAHTSPSTDLLGMVVHDIRGPLAGISGLADHVAGKYGAELPETAREELTIIAEESRRVCSLAEDLLALARAQGQALEREELDVGEVIEDVVARLRDQIADRGATVDVQRACTCFASRSALGQILQNLVENAIRHGAETPRIAIHCAHLGSEVRLDVMDDGPGIPAERRADVVQPFTQLDGRRGGSGLGLAIADVLADRLGGALSIGDSPLGGAKVSLHLPQRA